MPLQQRLLGKLAELLVFAPGLDLDPRRFVIQQQMRVFRRCRQGRVDGGSERMHQVGPGWIIEPQRAAAAAAKVALAGAGVDALFAFALEAGVIDADVIGALDLEAVKVAAEVDRISAAALRFAADRAIAALVRVGRVAVEREADGAAFTGALGVGAGVVEFLLGPFAEIGRASCRERV